MEPTFQQIIDCESTRVYEIQETQYCCRQIVSVSNTTDSDEITRELMIAQSNLESLECFV